MFKFDDASTTGAMARGAFTGASCNEWNEMH